MKSWCGPELVLRQDLPGVVCAKGATGGRDDDAFILSYLSVMATRDTEISTGAKARTKQTTDETSGKREESEMQQI